VEAPPPVLAGFYVVAYAEADDSVTFEQRRTLNVDGNWLGRVPYLAICQEFDAPRFAVQHCTSDWAPLGIAGGYGSAEEAREAIERSYHGISGKWVLGATSLDEARSLYEEQLRAEACSFCGKTPPQVTTMVGHTVRICGQCIDDFYDAIHNDGRPA
jgi:hypothetical protein